MLLDAGGADVNMAKKYGVTALLAAADGGHATLVSLLIGAGASVYHRDVSGITTLDIAMKMNKAECIKVLVYRTTCQSL